MNVSASIDHTNLKPFATTHEILRLCDEAKQYGFASVCVNPCNVALAVQHLEGSPVKVCTVVGFPFGSHTTTIKVAEAVEAMEAGADEIDMVINIGRLLDGDTPYVEQEVTLLAEACHKRGRLLKVIVETCYLNEAQIGVMCGIVDRTGADFIKTSTGYGSRGASEEDILLFQRYLTGSAKIKASGGIRTAEGGKKYIQMGCARLGTSNGKEIADGLADG